MKRLKSNNMNWTRRFRKKLTVKCLQFGQALAQKGDVRTIEAMRRGFRIFTKTALPLRFRLKKNMQLAGVYRDGLLDEHFERAIDQMALLAHASQGSFYSSGCLEKFRIDDSFKYLQQAYDKGKGVINIAPHLCAYPVYAGPVSARIPCVIYSRNSKDPLKMRITNIAANVGKAERVYPPANATKAQRLQVAIDVLRQGRLMFFTPDTPRKPHEGVPVTIFGRTAYFPIGTFIMSLRTGAPVVPAWWYWEDGIYHISYSPPIELQRGGRLKEKAEAATQQWAKQIDAFLRKHPDMWWNWLDKRWTRIIRNGSIVK
ncbi:MAG: lysophospholipid acyltransferase family protein [Planctomycetota bacterium]